MNAELDALERNETWDITNLPPGKRSIGCKWLYKTKYKSDGSIDRFKARLVILGCKQIQGVDYAETFAPVAKMSTVRTLLAVAAIEGWITSQVDVNNAFLHGESEETVYMALHQGYHGIGSRISVGKGELNLHTSTKVVCKLKKTLFGLKQAPRKWFRKLSVTLLDMGFKQSRADYSLFIDTTENTITLVLVYVDDLLLAGNSQKAINGLKEMLSKSFRMKDLGDLTYILGLEISRSQDGFFVSQKKYVMDILKEFGMINATPLKVPMNSHLKLIADKGVPLEDPHATSDC